MSSDLTSTSLQAELRQSRPFRSPSHEAVVAIWRTAGLLRRHFTGVIEPAGVTVQQYNVLRILRGAGAEGLPTLAIRDRMIEDAPGITRLVDRLLQAGLVERDRTQPDRRQVVCRITERGLALLASLDDAVHAADLEVLATLDEEEQRLLVSLLGRVREGLR